MKKYFVQNGKVIINKYCVTYSYDVESENLLTKSEVCQYLENDDELSALLGELEVKGIEYTVTELEVAGILKFDGVLVGSEEEARRLIEPTLEEVKADKILEISAVCQEKIFNGVDVTLANGETKHFSLKIEDQLNLNRLALIFRDAKEDCGIVYHADGEVCSEFSKEDFFKIVNLASEFISEETEKCNKLMKRVEELLTVEEVLRVECIRG